MSDIALTDDVQALKAEILKAPQFQPETTHMFAGGMYLRMVPRPAGCVIVGKVHKKEHFYVVAKGKVTVVSEGKRETYTAPSIVICKPGSQKAVYAHEDSICFTVHRTDKTDLTEIEAELVEADPESPFLPGNILSKELLT